MNRRSNRRRSSHNVFAHVAVVIGLVLSSGLVAVVGAAVGGMF